MKVYVASSWRNPYQPAVVQALRGDGHDVYDFREPREGERGFSWHELDPTIPPGPADLVLSASETIRLLGHPAAARGFELDMNALRWCDACVLVLPCGRSAHLEAGWAAGVGKLTVGLLAEGEPDLMWKMLDHLTNDIEGVRYFLREPGSTAPARAWLIRRCASAAQQGTLAGRIARGWDDMAEAVLIEAGVIEPELEEPAA